MKKATVMITTALTFSLSFAGSAFASPDSGMKLGLSTISKGTVQLASDDAYNGMIVPAQLHEGMLYVKAANSIGLTEGWSMDEKAETERVIISRDVTVFTGKDARIIARGEVIPVPGKVLEQMERGYYPVRLVYELASCQVSYKESEQTVSITGGK
jgi:hypothetical protein